MHYIIQTDEGMVFLQDHRWLANLIKDRYIKMNRSKRKILYAHLLDGIQEIDKLLQKPSVRRHPDCKISIPKVDIDSSLRSFLHRLQRQVNATCQLADAVKLGPAANVDEQAVLDRVRQVIVRIYKGIGGKLPIWMELPVTQVPTELENLPIVSDGQMEEASDSVQL